MSLTSIAPPRYHADSICEVKRAKKNHPVSPASRLGDYSLAFPPISTGVFQFDPKVAASLLEEVCVCS